MKSPLYALLISFANAKIKRYFQNKSNSFSRSFFCSPIFFNPFIAEDFAALILHALYLPTYNLCTNHTESYAVSAIPQIKEHPLLTRPRTDKRQTIFCGTERAAPCHLGFERNIRKQFLEFLFQYAGFLLSKASRHSGSQNFSSSPPMMIRLPPVVRIYKYGSAVSQIRQCSGQSSAGFTGCDTSAYVDVKSIISCGRNFPASNPAATITYLQLILCSPSVSMTYPPASQHTLLHPYE